MPDAAPPPDPSPSARPGLPTAVPHAIVAAATVAFFAPALFAGGVLSFRDLFFFHRPLRHVWTATLAGGHAPWLNAALNLGQPMLANPNYSALYPPNFIYLVLPFDAAWNVFLAGHVLWAALGAFWLARRLGAGSVPALVAAFAFGFSGPVVSAHAYYNLLAAASWTPWVLGMALCAWRHDGGDGRRWTAAAAAALAAQILTGEPTVILLTGACLGTGWLIASLRPPGRPGQRTRRIAGGVLIAGVAVLIAGAQIAPTLAWLPHADRAEGLPFRASAAWWSLHPARLLEMLAPHVHGNPTGRFGHEFWGGAYSDGGFPYLFKIAAGWLPLLLAPIAWRLWWGRAAVLGAAAATVLSLGHNLTGYYLLYLVLPPFRIVRYPEKFLLFAALGLALAAAAGAQRLLEEKGTTWLPAGIAALGGIVLVVAAIPILPPIEGNEAAQAGRLAALAAAAGTAIAATGVVFAATKPRLRRAAVVLLPAFAFVDPASWTLDVLKARPVEEVRRTPRLLEAAPDLAKHPVLFAEEDRLDRFFRIAEGPRDPFDAMQADLVPFTGLEWGVSYGATDDVDRMGWKEAARRTAFLQAGFPSPEAAALMRSLGIGAVISPFPTPHPMFHEAASAGATGDDPPPAHVLAPFPGPAPLVRWQEDARDGPWIPDATGIAWREAAPHRLEITLAPDRPAGRPIVVTRNALPGWTATSVPDGIALGLSATPEGLIRIDEASAASRTTGIVLAYRPPGLAPGAAMTFAGVLLLAWMLRPVRP